MAVLISNFALAGYRSFGAELQYVPSLSKINIFIGQNNAGKSNVIRFIKEVLGAPLQTPIKLNPLMQHMPTCPPLLVGVGVSPTKKADALLQGQPQFLKNFVVQVLQAKANLDQTDDTCWTIHTIPDRKPLLDGWDRAADKLSDQDIYKLWNVLLNHSQGSRKQHWQPDVIRRLVENLPRVNAIVIPAIREIGEKGSFSDEFDGTGLIERIAKIQNPDAHSQHEKGQFQAINEFLREVTDRPDAKIEIPYERDTILVHMDGKVLPIESLGSGLHEVLILASAATVLSEVVLCIEEPELHLNPILQKKLIRYLQKNTSNQYFITTHSAALMDTPEAEVYHVRLENGASKLDRVTSDVERSAVCADLGYHPSDLLQANCIIWVEGPSDRIYLNWWLHFLDPDLIEGIHYSLMFYGGRLASHLTGRADSLDVDDFISLRRLNQRSVIMIDSDKDAPRKQINATKKRLQIEFDSGPGHAWITAGREVENYLPVDLLKDAIANVCTKSTSTSQMGQYDHVLTLKSPKGLVTQAPKVDVAKFIVQKNKPDFTVLDLRRQLDRVLDFIRKANPKVLL